MLTKIALEDLDGNVVQAVDCALVEEFVDDRNQWQEGQWEQAIIWGDRVFVSVDIPDCDAPREYQRWFVERRVVAAITGDETALARQLKQMAAEGETA